MYRVPKSRTLLRTWRTGSDLRAKAGAGASSTTTIGGVVFRCVAFESIVGRIQGALCLRVPRDSPQPFLFHYAPCALDLRVRRSPAASDSSDLESPVVDVQWVSVIVVNQGPLGGPHKKLRDRALAKIDVALDTIDSVRHKQHLKGRCP